MSLALCPGSFDPVTVGHLDVITRAAGLFDEVLVAILHNPAKQGAFTVERRIAFIEEATSAVPGVRVAAYAGRLIVDVAREVGATCLLKGLRSETDFAYEVPMASMNRALTGIETLFLLGDPATAHISSSLVKEVARFGGEVRGMVPDPVRDALVALRA
ncbi:MAG: pantetheine-phosphate adenylyltransferase [Dermatophilaceae bacterium]